MLLYSESRSGALGSTVLGGWQGVWALLVGTYLLWVNHMRPLPGETSPAFPWRVSNTPGGTVTCGYQGGCQPRPYPWGWGCGGWQLPALQISGGAGGPAAAREAEVGGTEGEQQARDRGALPAVALGLGVKG